VYKLNQVLIVEPKRSSKRIVSADKRCDATLKRWLIDLAGKMKVTTDVIGWALRIDAMQNVQALLSPCGFLYAYHRG